MMKDYHADCAVCPETDTGFFFSFMIKVLLHFCVTESRPRRNAAFLFFPPKLRPSAPGCDLNCAAADARVA